MKSVDPFRSMDDLNRMLTYLKNWSLRNWMLVVVSIYSGLRISDELRLTVADVSGTHLRLRETKNRKTRQILIAPPLRHALDEYCKDLADDDLLFPSRQGYRRPITRARAYEIMRQAAKACGISNVGTHSGRKTFGRAVYEQTGSLTMLREIFGHRDEATTARYIGMVQDDHDAAIRKLRFLE